MNKKIFGIKIWEMAVFIGIYIVMSFLYRVTIWLSYEGYNRNDDSIFNFLRWFYGGGLQYALMMLSSALIWLLIFRACKNWSLKYRLLLHLVTLPLFVLVAQQVYYSICDFFGIVHLTGGGSMWDIYIPTLFYFIQFAVFHAYEYYVINQRKLRYEIELKNSALKSELSAIKAQLNPHFLYNVFNTINASVPPEMEDTRVMIAELSDIFRYQLRASREDMVPLKDELEFVEKYLKLEKRRFEERLTINFNVDETILEDLVPPMILQPLVENSVKHGISPLLKGGTIDITIKAKNNKLYFEISDTGIGVKDKVNIFTKGVGISNTQKRLEKMFDSSLNFSDNAPQGLTVQFTI
jgi:glucose-6-phosphate-specific signal transduction histidine kinase